MDPVEEAARAKAEARRKRLLASKEKREAMLTGRVKSSEAQQTLGKGQEQEQPSSFSAAAAAASSSAAISPPVPAEGVKGAGGSGQAETGIGGDPENSAVSVARASKDTAQTEAMKEKEEVAEEEGSSGLLSKSQRDKVAKTGERLRMPLTVFFGFCMGLKLAAEEGGVRVSSGALKSLLSFLPMSGFVVFLLCESFVAFVIFGGWVVDWMSKLWKGGKGGEEAGDWIGTSLRLVILSVFLLRCFGNFAVFFTVCLVVEWFVLKGGLGMVGLSFAFAERSELVGAGSIMDEL
uniref:Uncharacterized protein n=1 Tax=Chromera velia CCMP2878 TaxID=1169474 RepID=A0A0G4F8E5_9ALVE|eukprot:Cvel_15757.t1-p1 / transcript=Cvel_15757.t1 / gene=Cvel_15757 / organism=Chromera_velia_CCMP2878 / gene_product=hypothetical protein / transcript_product=hypothetical protein / location=Cvel_scaffold1180:26584-27456(+) / protein_length=291 / sequence_SO=supercontig / SO=protein_coding / is_pseudo=false